nr:putative reverse transcriptase domain-containing protein [Tanacetum cinerariifolium]
MTPTSTSSDGVWPCPFRGFHCCPDGEVGNKGFPRLISHLKRLHLSFDERKGVLREAISTDHELYMAVEETLKVINQWLCEKCMDLHTVSRACHHPDGLVCFSKGSDDMSRYIVGILKPFNKESGTEITEGLVFNAELLDHVVVQPDSIDARVRLLLFPRCTLPVYKPKNRQERGSENRKSLQQSSILKSLAMWEKDDDITTLVKSILDDSALGPLAEVEVIFKREQRATPTSSSVFARLRMDTLQPHITFFEPPIVAEIDNVFSCIKSFPKGTLCGRDGVWAQHILDALCGEGSAIATDLLKVITSVVNLWLAGRCLPILAEFVASAPHTPLLKPDNGIRPIAVGTIWRRLISKVAMKGVGKEMSKYLGDFQFRVGVSGDVEAILHSVNRVLSEYHNDGSLAMLTVDFSNALNLMDRSELLYEQGDPLGPLLFAFILHPLLHKIKDNCKLLLHAWYLDDGTVIGDSEEVARVLDIINVSGPGLGLELNIKKTKIFWPSCNGMKLREGLFPVNIRRPSSGVKLLRRAISRDANFISGLAMRRAVNAVDLMGLLPHLHDPHSELILLRSSSRAQSWVLQDHILRESGICGMNDDYVSALACLRDTILSFDVSGFTNKDTVPSKAQQTMVNVFFSKMIKDMKVHFDMTMRQKTVIKCLRAPHAHDFLLAILIDGLGQHMSPVKYRTILK